MNKLTLTIPLTDGQIAAVKWGARRYNELNPKGQANLEEYLALELGWRADALADAQREERKRLRIDAVSLATDEVAGQIEALLQIPEDPSKTGIDVPVPADPIEAPAEVEPAQVPADGAQSIKPG